MNLSTSISYFNPEMDKFSSESKFGSFLQSSLKPFQSLRKLSIDEISNHIYITKNRLKKQQQILEWRKNTPFPIVKVKQWNIVQTKRNNLIEINKINIELQSTLQTLMEIQRVPFFQTIYILKQALIGFERLYHKFGSFIVTTDMIKFTQDTQQCQVWINGDSFRNYPSRSSQKKQHQFISDLFKLIEQRTVRSKFSEGFFSQVSEMRFFFQAMKFIDLFVQENRIKVPKRLQIMSITKSPFQSIMKNLKKQKQIKIQCTSKHIPTFVKNKIEKKNMALTSRLFTQKTKDNYEERTNNSSSNYLISHSEEYIKNYSEYLIQAKSSQKDYLKHLDIPEIDSNQKANYPQSENTELFSVKMLRFKTKNNVENSLISQNSPIYNHLNCSGCQTNDLTFSLEKRKHSADILLSVKKNAKKKLSDNGEVHSKTIFNLLKCDSKSIRTTNIKSPREHNEKLEAQEQDCQDILRKNVIDQNGWSDFHLFSPSSQSMLKRSITDEQQIPQMNLFKTFDLPRLGVMGREVRSSRMSELEFELNYETKLQREKVIRNQVMDVLE